MAIMNVDCKCTLETPSPNEVFCFFFALRVLAVDVLLSGSNRLTFSLTLFIGSVAAFLCRIDWGLSCSLASSIAVFQALAVSSPTNDLVIQCRGQWSTQSLGSKSSVYLNSTWYPWPLMYPLLSHALASRSRGLCNSRRALCSPVCVQGHPRHQDRFRRVHARKPRYLCFFVHHFLRCWNLRYDALSGRAGAGLCWCSLVFCRGFSVFWRAFSVLWGGLFAPLGGLFAPLAGLFSTLLLPLPRRLLDRDCVVLLASFPLPLAKRVRLRSMSAASLGVAIVSCKNWFGVRGRRVIITHVQCPCKMVLKNVDWKWRCKMVHKNVH